MPGIVIGIVAIVALYLILKLLRVSAGMIMKFVWNGVIGLVLLFIFNSIGSIIGLSLEVNVINALIAGVFGIPGIILLLLVK